VARWKAADPVHNVDITVRVAPQGPYEAATGPWYDITSYVRSQGISIRRGRSDEFEHVQAATCTFELNNNNREFDPTIPTGYLSLPGISGNYASTPDNAALDITGNIDIRGETRLVDWSPAGEAKTLINKFNTVGGQASYMVQVDPNGRLRMVWTENGTLGTLQSHTSKIAPVIPADGWLIWRITVVVNFGGTSKIVTFWTADHRPIDDDEWEQLGDAVITAGISSIFSSGATSPLVVGGFNTATVESPEGQFRWFEIRNGISGTVVAAPDFGVQLTGTTSFTDMAGQVWTLTGTAAVQGGARFASIVKPRSRVEVLTSYADATHTLFTGSIDGWPQSWTKTTGTVQITATDALGMLATDSASVASSAFILDNPFQGTLDTRHNPLSGLLPQQFAGERIGTLLQLGGFSTGMKLDAGLSLLHELEPEGSLLQQIQDAESAEGGFLFVNSDGTFEFRDRHSRFLHPRMLNIQQTFTDAQYGNVEVDYSTTKVINDARINRSTPELVDEAGEPIVAASTEYLAFDHESIRKYGRKMYQIEIPVASDGDTEGRANFIINRYAEPKARPGEIAIKPRRDIATLLPAVLRLELLDRIRITRQPRYRGAAVGSPMSFLGLVEQISHTISNEDWQTTIATSFIDIDEGSNLMRVDNAEFGKLDLYLPAY
jgi:hypothetical protein